MKSTDFSVWQCKYCGQANSSLFSICPSCRTPIEAKDTDFVLETPTAEEAKQEQLRQLIAMYAANKERLEENQSSSSKPRFSHKLLVFVFGILLLLALFPELLLRSTWSTLSPRATSPYEQVENGSYMRVQTRTEQSGTREVIKHIRQSDGSVKEVRTKVPIYKQIQEVVETPRYIQQKKE